MIGSGTVQADSSRQSACCSSRESRVESTCMGSGTGGPLAGETG